jgi:hypothetical protein
LGVSSMLGAGYPTHSRLSNEWGLRTDADEKFAVRADATDEFPILVTKLSLYYDR